MTRVAPKDFVRSNEVKNRRTRWLFWSSLALLLTIFVGGYLVSLRVDPHAADVRNLVSQVPPSVIRLEPQVERELVRLGPVAYPELARLLRAHDTGLDRLYDEARVKLPASLRRLLPIRQWKG